MMSSFSLMQYSNYRHIACWAALGFVAICVVWIAQASNEIGFEPGEDRPGGDTTHERKFDRNSFSHASTNISFEQELNFKVGNGIFRRVWISSPASTQAADGLGPLFNSRGCQRCHIKDGRGHPPLGEETNSESLLLRLSIPIQNQDQQELIDQGKLLNVPDPVYGHQLQSFSVQGVHSEGKIRITHEPYEVETANGKKEQLSRPVYSVDELGYGPLHPQIRLSPRVAPQMIGLGLLEAIDEKDILRLADPEDKNSDGISGRPNRVWSKDKNTLTIGRFGHKAGVATINEQNQGAFSGDIGISTPLNPNPYGDCTEQQKPCFDAPHGNSPQYENLEVHSELTDLLLFYTRNLAVPARRAPQDPNIISGKHLFYQAGCTSCHQPSFTTPVIEGRAEHSNQKIWPYTDLLLHDMGAGLADQATEGQANGREWRTAPLWGIGLTEVVNGHTRFLHDGRARNLHEAVLWHAGEAENARKFYTELSKSQQKQTARFCALPLKSNNTKISTVILHLVLLSITLNLC